MRKVILAAITLSSALYSSGALARHGGIYLELEPAWGFYASEETIIEKDPGESFNSKVPVATFVPQIKAGFNLFGWAGAEAQVAGHYWDLEGDPGGAGYISGLVRVTPLEILSYVLPDDVKVPSLVPQGPVSWKDRPFDLGITMGGGYTITGEDYAYQGGFFQWGFDLKFYVTPNFALGFDFPFRHMLYQPFRYSNYSKHLGYCTDHEKAFGSGGQNVPDFVGEGGPEISASDIAATCTKPAPAAFFFAPAFTITGVFDFGI